MKAINETIANAIVESIEGNEGTFSVEVEANNTLVVTESRKRNETIQMYFDTEKSEYRSFKVANLIKIA